jgi:hypothetical protein
VSAEFHRSCCACGTGSVAIMALLRRYYGAIKGLLRLLCWRNRFCQGAIKGTIKALLRCYSGAIQALLRALSRRYSGAIQGTLLRSIKALLLRVY